MRPPWRAVKSAAFAEGANDYLVKLPDKIELIARIRYHSKAYMNQLQRDEAYRALRVSQQLLVEKNIELGRLTNVDGLTGLSNRRYFNEFVEDQWKRAIREQTRFSILMIDVDDFKSYNDTYGHLAGDEVLKSIGEAIKRCAERPADITARFGGDEFVVALPASPLGGAQAFGEKVHGGVERLGILHSGSSIAGAITVTVTIGCASTIPGRGDSVLSLIERADPPCTKPSDPGEIGSLPAKKRPPHPPTPYDPQALERVAPGSSRRGRNGGSGCRDPVPKT